MDFYPKEDTICAVATPIGEGGIGVIKISGPEALSIALSIFQSASHKSSPLSSEKEEGGASPSAPAPLLRSHRLYYGWVRDPAIDEPIDEVLLSYMAAPHSYTCEDVVEINCHSGFAVLNRLLQLVLKQGARLADPGEFTRRAFLNGRIDLSQAEAVIDIIHSRSQQSLAAANRHLRGDFRDRIRGWREQILQLQSEVEVSIDFAEDVEEESVDFLSLGKRLKNDLIFPLQKALDHYDNGRILREGLSLVLVGKPNVGKSSLLNALVGKDRAIVTPFPGTTRDVVEDSFLLSGVQVRILDTAGIRRKPDAIESIGIERTLQSLEEADVALWLIDQSRPLSEEDDLIFEALGSVRCVILLNKTDLPPAVTLQEVRERYGKPHFIFQLSALNPSDIERLQNELRDAFLKNPLENSRSAIIPNLRHKECLERTLAILLRVERLLEEKAYPELTAMELQSARRELESVLGQNVDEDLLDRIFSQFCIGK